MNTAWFCSSTTILGDTKKKKDEDQKWKSNVGGTRKFENICFKSKQFIQLQSNGINMDIETNPIIRDLTYITSSSLLETGLLFQATTTESSFDVYVLYTFSCSSNSQT